MKLLLFFILPLNILFSQNISNPFRASHSPEEEIGMLLSCSSFAQILENYKGDSLVEKRLTKTFYNYGNKRYSFEHDLNGSHEVDRVVTLHILSDTFSLQTRQIFDWEEVRLDSILIFSKWGNVVRVEFREDGQLSRSILFEYNNNLLVRKTYNSKGFGQTTFDFKYRKGRMIESKSTDFKGHETVKKIHYSDSLITITQERNEPFLKTIKQLIRIDEEGNLVSEREYYLTSKGPDFELVSITQYEYPDDDTIIEIVEKMESNIVTITTIEQNELKSIKTT